MNHVRVPISNLPGQYSRHNLNLLRHSGREFNLHEPCSRRNFNLPGQRSRPNFNLPEQCSRPNFNLPDQCSRRNFNLPGRVLVSQLQLIYWSRRDSDSQLI